MTTEKERATQEIYILLPITEQDVVKKHADTATALHAKYLIIKHGSKLHLGKYMQDTYSIEGCIIQS